MAMEPILKDERTHLRDLARRAAAHAGAPAMEERRRMWRRHNDLESPRPLVLIFPEGSWNEILPESNRRCRSYWGRWLEWELLWRITDCELYLHDKPIEPWICVPKAIHSSGWGLEPRRSESSQEKGAAHYEQVLGSLDDLRRMHFPQISHDATESRTALEIVQECIGDILDVRLKGIRHLSFHLMAHYTQLRGLEQAYLDMCMEPQFVHDAMSFLEQGNHHMIDQYETQGLLELNNDDTYHSSGGMGYTAQLPQTDFDGVHVRPADMWSSAESQELASVSPDMHEEFALRYERRLLGRFGLNGYGCCEPLHDKLHLVKSIPNIRRISISPWANVRKSAEELGSRYIFSWKPNPAMLVGDFNEAGISSYVREMLEATRGCVVEIILKDTHTCENRPERFTRWSELVMELVQRYGRE
jgi:hypothetical protein